MKKITVFCKKYWKLLLAGLSAITGVVLFFILRKTPTTPTKKEEIIIPTLEQKVEAQKEETKAQVEAAAVIAEARGEANVVVRQVEAIANEPVKTNEDKKRQLEELANLANSTR